MKQIWFGLALFLLIFGIALFSGCIEDDGAQTNGGLSDQKIVKLYAEALPSGVDEKYANAVREAASYWETRKDVTFKEVSSKTEADVVVFWIKEFGTQKLGHAMSERWVEIGLGDSGCMHKWQAFTYELVLSLAEHELGHALGLDDDYNNSEDIMYYKSNTRYETDVEETEVIADGWFMSYPVCTSESAATYDIEIQVESGGELNVKVVPTKEDYNLLINHKPFMTYTTCNEDKTKYYNKTCAVSSDARVVLENPRASGTGEATKFKITIKETTTQSQ
ncbi:MAG: hypothetical protein NTW59_05270 [Candidatus Diapherotrites archaeon]|nr:hypothetical protein [Candidatus Diapherotrites archaeon]